MKLWSQRQTIDDVSLALDAFRLGHTVACSKLSSKLESRKLVSFERCQRDYWINNFMIRNLMEIHCFVYVFIHITHVYVYTYILYCMCIIIHTILKILSNTCRLLSLFESKILYINMVVCICAPLFVLII